MCKFWMMVLCMSVPIAYAQGIVKCVEPSGKVTYQQGSCATGSQSGVNTTNANPSTAGAAFTCYQGMPSHLYQKCVDEWFVRQKLEAAKQDREIHDILNPSKSQITMRGIKEGEKAAERGNVVIGQLSGDVTRAWGPPRSVKTSESGSGVYETWTYMRDGRPVQVSIRNMIVYRIDY